jgi:hypothetical protein
MIGYSVLNKKVTREKWICQNGHKIILSEKVKLQKETTNKKFSLPPINPHCYICYFPVAGMNMSYSKRKSKFIICSGGCLKVFMNSLGKS